MQSWILPRTVKIDDSAPSHPNIHMSANHDIDTRMAIFLVPEICDFGTCHSNIMIPCYQVTKIPSYHGSWHYDSRSQAPWLMNQGAQISRFLRVRGPPVSTFARGVWNRWFCSIASKCVYVRRYIIFVYFNYFTLPMTLKCRHFRWS